MKRLGLTCVAALLLMGQGPGPNIGILAGDAISAGYGALMAPRCGQRSQDWGLNLIMRLQQEASRLDPVRHQALQRMFDDGDSLADRDWNQYGSGACDALWMRKLPYLDSLASGRGHFLDGKW